MKAKLFTPLILLSVLIPTVRAQFVDSFFSGVLDKVFFVASGVSPYDKLISFALIFVLLTAAFILGLTKAFGESNRQIKAVAVALALMASYGIVAGTNFSIAQFGGLALGLLAIVVFMVIFAIVRKFGMEEHPLLAFLITLVLTALLVFVLYMMATNTTAFGSLFDGRESSTSDRDTYSGVDGGGFFSRLFGRGESGDRPQPDSGDPWYRRIIGGGGGSGSVRGADTVRCEERSSYDVKALWGRIWNSQEGSELDQLWAIKEQCKRERDTVLDEISRTCAARCGDDIVCETACQRDLDGKRLDAESKYDGALYNFLTSRAMQYLRNGETDNAIADMQELDQEVGGGFSVSQAGVDQDMKKEIEAQIKALEGTGQLTKASRLQEQLTRFIGARDISEVVPSCEELTNPTAVNFYSMGLELFKEYYNGEGKSELEQLKAIESKCKLEAEDDSLAPEVQARAREEYYRVMFEFHSQLGEKLFRIGELKEARKEFKHIVENAGGNWRIKAVETWDSLLAEAYRGHLNNINSHYSTGVTEGKLEDKVDDLIELQKDLINAHDASAPPDLNVMLPGIDVSEALLAGSP